MTSEYDIIMGATIRVPADELVFTYARSSGAGGQNVNKVNSKAQLRWNLRDSPGVSDDVKGRFLEAFASRVTDDGWVVIASEAYRDQPRNRDDCVTKLRDMLSAVARPPKKRKPTKPTRGSVTRRLESKRRRSETKTTRRSDW